MRSEVSPGEVALVCPSEFWMAAFVTAKAHSDQSEERVVGICWGLVAQVLDDAGTKKIVFAADEVTTPCGGDGGPPKYHSRLEVPAIL